MRDWTTLRAHMRGAFTLEYDDAEAVRLTWSIDGVLQTQWLHPVRAFGVPQVMIVCPVVAEAELPARDAVRHNNSLAVGALALSSQGYVMRAVMPIETVSFATFDRMLEVLAHEAARIRTNVTRARGAAATSAAAPAP